MKNSLRIIYFVHILALVAVLTWSCNPKSECMDIDYGTYWLMDSIASPFPYKQGDTLFFKEASGQELMFIMPSYTHSGLVYWNDYSQDLEEGDCAGKAKIISRREEKIVNFRSDSLNYFVICQYFVNSKIVDNKPVFFDVINATIFQMPNFSNWGTYIGHLADDRGNDVSFIDTTLSYTLEADQVLGMKEFHNVYSKYDPDGSELHFNHELGVVAFRERNNPLWVLDRIE